MAVGSVRGGGRGRKKGKVQEEQRGRMYEATPCAVVLSLGHFRPS
jgi:hypothetical protein